MFGADPSSLRHIPASEYHKRKLYWQEVQKVNRPNVEVGPGGVEIEHSNWKPEEGAIIIE